MTPQEAINRIDLLIVTEKLFIKISTMGEISHSQNIEALEIAKQALEKQIPKKPLDICTPVVTWGLCPICKGELNKLGNRPNRVFEGTKYCPDCGQALDWSED